MESALLDIAGHRRSPATMLGYTEAVHPATRASRTPPIPQNGREEPSALTRTLGSVSMSA